MTETIILTPDIKIVSNNRYKETLELTSMPDTDMI